MVTAAVLVWRALSVVLLLPAATAASVEQSVEDFLRDCETGVNEWRTGQVDYSAELKVAINGSATYNAAVDIRDSPLPPDEVILVPGSSSFERIDVQCTIAAQLVPAGEHLVVDGQRQGEWLNREFTPTGVVEWSWSVTAKEPVDQDLRLLIRPAILAKGGLTDGTFYGESEASLITHVKVDASFFHRFSHWFKEQWPLLSGVAVVLGGGVLTFTQWLSDLFSRKTPVVPGEQEAEAQPKKPKKRKGKVPKS